MMRTFCFAAPKGDRKNMISFHPVAAVSQWGEILSEIAFIHTENALLVPMGTNKRRPLENKTSIFYGKERNYHATFFIIKYPNGTILFTPE